MCDPVGPPTGFLMSGILVALDRHPGFRPIEVGETWCRIMANFQDPTKIILVVLPRDVAKCKEFFQRMGMNVFTGSRYPDVFIGYQEAETTWLDKKVQGWAESLRMLLGVDRNHTHSVYAGMQKSLQQEWEFVQRVTPDIGGAFGPLEITLQDTFIPVLLQGVG